MAKIVNPKEPVRFTPADQESRDESERVTYLITVPGHWSRVAFRKDLVRRGIVRHTRLDMLRAMLRGMKKIVGVVDPTGASHGEMIGAIEAVIAAHESYFADYNAGLYPEGDEEAAKAMVLRFAEISDAASDLAPLRKIVSSYVPAFADMLADEETYSESFCLVAIETFLAGWENMPQPFRKSDVGGIPGPLLDLIPPAHVGALGARIESLLTVSEPEAKNSDSPSLSSSSQTTSPAASTTDSTIH